MTLSKHLIRGLGAVVLAASTQFAHAQQGDNVKIAFIDPLSGPFANIGVNLLREYQYMAERESGANNPAGVKYEVLSFDSKGSPQEAVNALNAAIAQGARYITQGMSSGVSAALADAIAKHNARNPGKEVLFMDYGNADPDLSGSKCSYWAFRMQTHVGMLGKVLATAFKQAPNTKATYFINQDYAFGRQFAKYTRDVLAQVRPDIKIVGDEYVALGQVKDFAPYVAKIKASGADSVATANWGSDLTLLIKAARDAGLSVDWYAVRASAAGTPAIIGPNDAGRIKNVDAFYAAAGGDMTKFVAEYKARYKDDVFHAAPYQTVKMLSAAFAKAKSTDPVKVARALEDLTIPYADTQIRMRGSDHLLQQPLHLLVWQKTDAKNPLDVEGTGFTWASIGRFDANVAEMPSDCKMQRPAH